VLIVYLLVAVTKLRGCDARRFRWSAARRDHGSGAESCVRSNSADWCAGRRSVRYGGDDVGEHERAEGLRARRDNVGTVRVAHGVEFAGEEIPQAAAEDDPSGYGDHGPDRNRNRTIAMRRRRKLTRRERTS